MIAKLTGRLDGVVEGGCVLDVNGVGYLVSCSTRTASALPPPPERAVLLVETQARMSGAKGRDLMQGRPGRCSATLGGSAENRGGPLGEMTATRDVAVAVACSIMP